MGNINLVIGWYGKPARSKKRKTKTGKVHFSSRRRKPRIAKDL